MKQLHTQVFQRFLCGFSCDVLQKEVKNYIQRLKPSRFYSPACKALEQAQERGGYTVLLSNGPSFLVGPLARYLGFHESHATTYNIDSQGRLESLLAVLGGKEKAACLEQIARSQGIKIENSVAYSDSYSDLPFLQMAGRAIAVRPDRRLRQISRRQHWTTL